MKTRIVLCFIFSLLLFSVMAELPSAPPPVPGEVEDQAEQQTVGEQATITTAGSTLTVSADASVQELQQKIAVLEDELSALKKKSAFLSTPFIISLSINITLLILIFYLLKKVKNQPAQY